MATVKKMVLTDLGRQDLIKAKAEGRAVQWTTICLGDGNGSTPQLNPQATKLINERWSGELTSKMVSSKDPNVLTIHAVVPADVGDFWVREAGIKNDQGELVIVAQTITTQKLSFESSGILSELDMYFDLKVSNAEIIEVAIDESNVYATMREVLNLREHLANSDKQIEANKNAISDLDEKKADRTELQEVDDRLGKRLDGHDTKLSEHDTKLSEHDTQLNNLGTRVEKLEKIHETLVGSSAPTEPTESMVWFDLNERIIKVYHNGSWIPFGAVYL